MTIELTDEARAWLVKNGYDEAMGARPMARVIQTQIKTPLADEVLFGRLKNGGVVKVVVTADETGAKKLGFVYPEGPAQPRLERDIIVSAGARARSRKRAEPADSGPTDDQGARPGRAHLRGGIGRSQSRRCRRPSVTKTGRSGAPDYRHGVEEDRQAGIDRVPPAVNDARIGEDEPDEARAIQNSRAVLSVTRSASRSDLARARRDNLRPP